jgi:hypothetical protein
MADDNATEVFIYTGLEEVPYDADDDDGYVNDNDNNNDNDNESEDDDNYEDVDEDDENEEYLITTTTKEHIIDVNSELLPPPLAMVLGHVKLFLPILQWALLGAALTPSSTSLQSNWDNHKWEVLDFSDLDKDLAARLTDDDLYNILTWSCSRAIENIETYRLRQYYRPWLGNLA